MDIFLPKKVKNCILTLENAGYEAFCVGGAVRDLLMGKQPYDFDVATNCPPEITQTLFRRTVPTGIKHGTITVVCDDMPIEVTTYRTESGYADSRHPDAVNFVSNIKEDLSRRDFTVNAIAYNESSGLFDPFGGYGDIERQTLRTVGNAEMRFSEDALRIMRLYRFASQLGFSIDEDTAVGAKKQIHLLKKISAERIFGELCKLLSGRYIGMGAPLFSFGGLEFLGLPACDISVLEKLPNDRSLRFAALMIISGADDSVFANLKADNILKNDTKTLLSLYGGTLPQSRRDIKMLLCETDETNLKRYFSLCQALKNIDCGELLSTLDDILKNHEPYRISDLAVTGEDVAALGFSGKEIGSKLEFLRRHICENPSLNKKDELISLIK